MRIFLAPLSIPFLDPKSLVFLFTTKNNLIWGVKCEKLNFRKSSGIHKISFKHCSWMEPSSGLINSWPQVIENSRQWLLLRSDILQKTIAGCPWHCTAIVVMENKLVNILVGVYRLQSSWIISQSTVLIVLLLQIFVPDPGKITAFLDLRNLRFK